MTIHKIKNKNKGYTYNQHLAQLCLQ